MKHDLTYILARPMRPLYFLILPVFTLTLAVTGTAATGSAVSANVFVDTRSVVLTVSATVPGQGTVSGGGSYTKNATATVSALPATGYAFVEWTGAATGNANPLYLVMNADKTIAAKFRGQYSITGHVYCSCDNSPVGGVLVDVGGQLATTDDTGGYTISFTAPGQYSVAISRQNYSAVAASLSIASGAYTMTRDFSIAPNGFDIATLNAVVPNNSIYQMRVNNGTAVRAFFTPGLSLTLAQAACRLGFDHFNWYQTISGESYKGIFNCSPTKSYNVDPPATRCDGTPNCIHITETRCENADRADLYYNEGPAFPGFYNITNKVSPDGRTLAYYDQPSVLPFDRARLVTSLAGVKADGSYTVLPGAGTFEWESDFNGLWGGAVIICASELALTNGTGGVGIIKTNVQPADIPPEIIALTGERGGGYAVTVKPQTQSVVAGGSVAFFVYPTNSFIPPIYQWRKNGMKIVGATNQALYLQNVITNDSARYDAILSDTNSAVGSTAGSLVVLAAPKLQAPVLAPSGHVVLSWIAAQGRTYQAQYRTNLAQGNWLAFGSPIIATTNVQSLTNLFTPSKQVFYRILQQ